MHLKKLIVFSLLVICQTASLALADMWPPAERALYISADHKTRLIILPRVLNKAGITSKCMAQLEETKNGAVVVLWKRSCVNSYAPNHALVSNHGKYAVTFDNWASLGYGPDVIVIYGPKGKVIRSLALSDLLLKGEITKLPHSSSSIHWSGNHYIEPTGEVLILKVAEPGSSVMPWEETAKFKDIKIRLADGKVLFNEFRRK